MDHADFIDCSFMANSIVLKRVNDINLLLYIFQLNNAIKIVFQLPYIVLKISNLYCFSVT